MKQFIKNQLSSRQQCILKIIEKSHPSSADKTGAKPVNNKTILEELEKEFGKIARVTVIRDLNDLIKKDYIERKGQGRSTIYGLKSIPC